jgi:hypothetical protein
VAADGSGHSLVYCKNGFGENDPRTRSRFQFLSRIPLIGGSCNLKSGENMDLRTGKGNDFA